VPTVILNTVGVVLAALDRAASPNEADCTALLMVERGDLRGRHRASTTHPIPCVCLVPPPSGSSGSAPTSPLSNGVVPDRPEHGISPGSWMNRGTSLDLARRRLRWQLGQHLNWVSEHLRRRQDD